MFWPSNMAFFAGIICLCIRHRKLVAWMTGITTSSDPVELIAQSQFMTFFTIFYIQQSCANHVKFTGGSNRMPLEMSAFSEVNILILMTFAAGACRNVASFPCYETMIISMTAYTGYTLHSVNTFCPFLHNIWRRQFMTCQAVGLFIRTVRFNLLCSVCLEQITGHVGMDYAKVTISTFQFFRRFTVGTMLMAF